MFRHGTSSAVLEYWWDQYPVNTHLNHRNHRCGKACQLPYNYAETMCARSADACKENQNNKNNRSASTPQDPSIIKSPARVKVTTRPTSQSSEVGRLHCPGPTPASPPLPALPRTTHRSTSHGWGTIRNFPNGCTSVGRHSPGEKPRA